MKIKKSKIFIITMLLLCFALSIMPMEVFAATEISKVEIGGSKFNYNAGDKPESYAIRTGDTAYYYDIEYEYWEEMETNTSGESVPVKFWYSDESKNNALTEDKKITSFEEGKTYMYSISLKSRDGYTFADNTEVYVNSEKVDALNVIKNASGLFITAIKTIKPTKPVQKQYIDEVEINNATVSFKAGDKPIFTGEVSDDAPYVYRAEFWETDGGNKGHNSSSMWNDNNPDKLFNTFEGGKTYTYGIYFVSYDYKGYFFTRDTKLKINGKYYNYNESDWESQPDVNEFSTMWVTTNLTMTPTEKSGENPTTPSEPEKPSDEPTAPTTPTQETEKEPQTPEDKTEQTKNDNDTKNPKTGDNIITSVIVFATSLATIGVLTIANMKRTRE